MTDQKMVTDEDLILSEIEVMGCYISNGRFVVFLRFGSDNSGRFIDVFS